MTEDDTFRKLRRTSRPDFLRIMDNFYKTLSHSNEDFDNWFAARNSIIRSHGWTPHEYLRAKSTWMQQDQNNYDKEY